MKYLQQDDNEMYDIPTESSNISAKDAIRAGGL